MTMLRRCLEQVRGRAQGLPAGCGEPLLPTAPGTGHPADADDPDRGPGSASHEGAASDAGGTLPAGTAEPDRGDDPNPAQCTAEA